MSLLYVKDLCITYRSGNKNYPAVVNVSFDIQEGEIVSLVGESGSGKSSVALAIGRLTDYLSCSVTGSLIFKDKPIFQLDPRELRDFRRREIAYVFQEPATSLNPVFKVGDQIREVLEKKDAKEAKELLRKVQLVDVERVYRAYPHELSGGMKQRAMIAMALGKQPDLLIADEPTTALDVTVQKEILRLLLQLKRQRALSILLITHDLRVASAISDRILIMQHGKLVEEIKDPKKLEVFYPYSVKLLSCARMGGQPKSFFEV